MFSLQSNEKVSKYANFLQTKCMKKRLTRYFYDFKVAKGTVIYGESNKSANLMPSLQACGSALFGIESNFVEEHPNLVREYEEGNDFDKEKEIKLYTNDKAGKSGSTISPSMTPAPSTTSSTGSNCVSR